MLPGPAGRAMEMAPARRMMLLYAGVVLGAAWVIVALLAQYNEDFFLYGVFRDLGFLFWVVFTVLGLALVASLSWASIHARDDELVPQVGPAASLDPVKLAPAWNPMNAPSEERTKCARCGRTLPIWRMPEGTCTVCAPFSVFLDPPNQARKNAELEKRRTRLFVLQGLGLAMLALSFVSAVYLFPLVVAPQRPVLATLGFLVFSPLLFGLILVSYAYSQHVPDADA
jgi:hypothetical protein